MTIQEIIHQPDRNIKSATIHLNYDEIRDLSNMLVQISKEDNFKTKGYQTLRRDFFLLFELVKNGCIDGWTCTKLYDLHKNIMSDKKDTSPE